LSSGKPFQLLPPGSPGRAMTWNRHASFPVAASAIPSFFETKESGGVQNRSEKNRIVVF
jgi:hypothetical protein